MRCTGWVQAVVLALLPCALGAQEAVLVLDGETLTESSVLLPSAWRYHSGDDPEYSQPALDDSSWRTVDSAMRAGGLPADWPGIGWFRLHLEVAAELETTPLAIDLELHGALDLFLDGAHLASYGAFASEAGDTVPAAQSQALHLSIPPGLHVLAVRYENPLAGSFTGVGWPSGFIARLGSSNAIAQRELGQARRIRSLTGWFCGIFLSFAVLHLLLFAFYPSFRENLFFSLLCISAAALVFLLLYKREVADPRFMLFSEPAMNVAGVLLGLFALRFVYGVFYSPLPRHWRFVVAVAMLLCVWGAVNPVSTLTFVFLAMLASCLELIRVVIVALVRRKPGSAILGGGVFALGLGFGLGVLSNLGFLPRTTTLNALLPFLSMIALVLSMSIYLSLTFARTQGELRVQLAEVQRLSAEKLAQERRARKEELERELLRAENDRKTSELEEARDLQLSMLPAKLPDVAGLEIAAHMETATEVGGDYYDFHLEDDGALTFAVGDATGHGLRAGTMVTATKSLFQALAPQGGLVDTLQLSGRVLKRMNLRRLAMALILGRYEGGRLAVAAAGMPPIYIFRSGTSEIESISLPGMPLGTLAGFPYERAEIELHEGDSILFMSDGFPERLNPKEEMLGYERAVEAFARCGTESAGEIVEGLLGVGEAWAEGLATDDDITFVVLKRNAGA